LQNDQRAIAIDQKWLGRTAEAILSAARAETAELSVLLVSDRRMRSLNRRYRKKDRATDVLAFPLTSTLSSAGRGEGEGQKPLILLGDVVISMQTAKRQAKEFGHSLRDEIERLLVHGILHLLGYDHERNVRAAAVMARRERAILKKISGRPLFVKRYS
jgi:rRNA maturation RNase YbeY